MFQAVPITNTATDHGGIIYYAPPASNYALTQFGSAARRRL
jgi:hypothetical protein